MYQRFDSEMESISKSLGRAGDEGRCAVDVVRREVDYYYCKVEAGPESSRARSRGRRMLRCLFRPRRATVHKASTVCLGYLRMFSAQKHTPGNFNVPLCRSKDF